MARKNPQAQRRLHIAAEAVGLAVVAPGLLSIAVSAPLKPRQRQFLIATALGTLVIDGYLLMKWLGE